MCFIFAQGGWKPSHLPRLACKAGESTRLLGVTIISSDRSFVFSWDFAKKLQSEVIIRRTSTAVRIQLCRNLGVEVPPKDAASDRARALPTQRAPSARYRRIRIMGCFFVQPVRRASTRWPQSGLGSEPDLSCLGRTARPTLCSGFLHRLQIGGCCTVQGHKTAQTTRSE